MNELKEWENSYICRRVNHPCKNYFNGCLLTGKDRCPHINNEGDIEMGKIYEAELDEEFEMKVIDAGQMNDIKMKDLILNRWTLVEITDDGYGNGNFIFKRKKQ